MNLSWRSLIHHVLPQKAVVPPDALHSERREEQRVISQISVKLRWEAGDEICKTVGVAENVSESGFSILIAEPLETGRTVYVTGRSVTDRKAIVRHCRATEGGYVLGVRAISRERRRVDRLPVDGIGSLRFGDTKGQITTTEATVKNVSNGGMQLSSGAAAPPQSYVQLTGETIACEGTVRYCRKEGDVWLLGVQFIREPAMPSAVEAEDF